MSLRWRVALALAALGAATTLAVGVIGYVTTRGRLVQEVDRSLEAAGASLEVRPGGIDLPRRGLLDLYVQTLSAGGAPVDSTWDRTFTPGAESEDVVGQSRAVVYETVDTEFGPARIRTEGLPGGAFQVARAMEETESVLADLRWRTALLVGVVSAIAAVIGWVLARSVAAPLSRLTAAATDVQESGRLDVEVPVSGHDEVGRLGAAFNGMLGALASSRADQQRLVEDAGHELRTPLT
ncbi:MAG: HAMP domain-containing protein, partial [Acidimicrobiia bacterium]|nr:HAMP domain-containing protein [Acidimicrobiia bacterium]